MIAFPRCHPALAATALVAALLTGSTFAGLRVASAAVEQEPAAKPDGDLPAVEAPAPDAPVGDAPAADEEPPMEYVLELDGQPVDLQLDREATIDLPGGKQVKARLTAKPERQFRAGGVSFRYPRQHAFEVERDGDTITWTFDGNDNVLILTRHAVAEIAPDDLRDAVVQGLVAQYGPENCKTSDAAINLGGEKRDATRVAASLAGARLVQDVVAWTSDAKAGNGEAAVYVLIVQDSPPDDAQVDAKADADATSTETKQVLKLLEQTFKQESN